MSIVGAVAQWRSSITSSTGASRLSAFSHTPIAPSNASRSASAEREANVPASTRSGAMWASASCTGPLTGPAWRSVTNRNTSAKG